ncbi:MAG TPA: amidohydrolase family protein [Actinomycetales bacterium]|nr:amidohydrolase family protein [Actinomycetales bacterium]
MTAHTASVAQDRGTAHGVVDFRVRPPFRSFLGLPHFSQSTGLDAPVWERSGLELTQVTAPSQRLKSMELFLAEMEEAGIGKAVVVGRHTARRGSVENTDVVNLMTLYPDKFVGFGALTLEGDVRDEVQRHVDWGFKGVIFEPTLLAPPRHVDDPSLDDVYGALEEAGLVLMLMMSVYVGPDATWSHPVRLQRVLDLFPRLPVVVSHVCWPNVDEFLGLAFRYPNLYAMPDLYGNTPGLPGRAALTEAVNSFLSHRMVFGSAYPARALGASIEEFKSWEFADEMIRDRCLSGNASRLLGLA